MTPRRSPPGIAASPLGTAASPLLYWLLVVCGLAGLTLQRFDAPGELVPLWAGTVVGVALGQLIGWLRVRGWVLASIAMAAAWFSPVFFFVLYDSIRGPVQICALAFLPAALCGYLSLSERGGLVAFWYPTVLWMLVILDGPHAFDARAALPFVIGLAVLFVAFLRARETRRVAFWNMHGSARRATPLPRAVLRASPLRAASSFAWTGLAGAGALVLAAWIAPHLWQKEHGQSSSLAAAQPVPETVAGGGFGQELPCCPAHGVVEDKAARPREYFPLLHGQSEQAQKPTPPPCTVCRFDEPVATTTDNGSGVSGGTSEGPSGGASWTPSMSSGGTSTVTPSLPEPTPAVAAKPPVPKPTTPKSPAPASPKPKVIVAAATPPPPTPPPATPTSATPTSAPPSTSMRPAVVVFVPKPAAPPADPGAPWKSMLAFCVGGLALHVLVRAIRRQLTLRHLTRPFWAETLDQRISNHWQRILIGLRDAGINAAPGEQPHALAHRVGIEGMETCSTILERVRHGVRVDATDLEEMDAAAGAVYRAARAKAGIAGRTAAWIRWPLA